MRSIESQRTMYKTGGFTYENKFSIAVLRIA